MQAFTVNEIHFILKCENNRLQFIFINFLSELSHNLQRDSKANFENSYLLNIT